MQYSSAVSPTKSGNTPKSVCVSVCVYVCESKTLQI